MATDDKTVFDFAALESTDTSTQPIVNPKTGDDIPGATITVYGQESEHYQTATSRMRSRITEFMRRNPGMKPEQRQKHFDQFEKDRNLSCIASIDGFIYKGKALKDPKDICEKFNFVYTQAITHIDNAANFIVA